MEMRFHIWGTRGSSRRPEETLEKLQRFCENEGSEAQILDAGMVFGRSHILSAYEHAKRAFDEERNSSKSFVNEVVLYASGERQISAAIKKMGIKKSSEEFCILIVGDLDLKGLEKHMGFERDDSVLEGNADNLRTFGISKKEIGTVPEDRVFDLVLERVAMVDLLK